MALDLRGLVGANDVFRLSAGLKRDPAVEPELDDGHSLTWI